jgi:hypothetical protein
MKIGVLIKEPGRTPRHVNIHAKAKRQKQNNPVSSRSG